jgi:predicted DNA-binding antitoxin AbrB/MazE fold protein
MTIQAIYKDGVLKPLEPLNLAENQTVSLEVLFIEAENQSRESLFGKFPELAQLTDDDFAWAKRLWEHGLEKQLRILDGAE